MPKLQDIPSLPTDAAELLEAVGYLDARDLADADLAELHAELVKANDTLHILPDTPTKKQLRAWRESLGGTPDETTATDDSDTESPDADDEAKEETDEITAEEESPGDDRHEIGIDPETESLEDDPEVIEMLEISPEAELLPTSLVKRHKIAVADIPEGILLTQCEGEVEINVLTTSRASDAQRNAADAKRTGLMTSRIRSFDQADSADHTVKPLDRGTMRDSVSLSEDLNKGLDPGSRRFVRGVLHPDPISVRTSAFFALLVQLFLVANFIGIPWLLIHEHLSGESMLWWVVGLSIGLLLSALCYLFWGLSARCRVCGQRQFAPKKCLKNKKAHHLKLIGYIFPTALHAIFFKWFYCTYCGTAVRLKK